MEFIVNIKEIDGTQMAAKIVGDFKINENSFPFTAIAFGRIGGQNIGVKLTDDVESILVDGKDVYASVKKLAKSLVPTKTKKIKLFKTKEK